MNDNITPQSYDVLLTTRSSWTGTIEAASPAEAVAIARQIWHSDCPHPFDRAGDDELDSVRLAEPQPPPPDEPPGPGLKRFRVSFDQPVIHTVLVTAPDEETAIDAATDLYIETEGLFIGAPPDGWRVDWGHWQVCNADEVHS